MIGIAPNSTVERDGSLAMGHRIEGAVRRRIIGQEAVVRRLLAAILAGGHVLLEGVPGLAKTLMVRSIAQALDVSFKRIQFTPDLLPSDVVGSVVFRPDTGSFDPSPGPIFANIVLADELNRAPAKVQSALLEAMEEGQVTLGGTSLTLPKPFVVLATENPLEQQGTYPLSEAQLDRFLLLLPLGYPERRDEERILRAAAHGSDGEAILPVATGEELLRARQAVEAVRVDDALLEYVVSLARATRDPVGSGIRDLDGIIEHGVSPRAAIGLMRVARAWAFLRGGSYVLPEDLKALAPDVFRHRIVLRYDAAQRGWTPDRVIERILASVAIP